MSLVSWKPGRDALTFCGICFGLVLSIMGLIFYYIIEPMAGSILDFLFLVLSFAGLVFLTLGLATYPGTRRRGRIYRQVLEIAAVEKEVQISEIQYRTGIDAETVRAILVHCLISGILFGHIDDDLFVRDTSGRRSTYVPHNGLGGL